MGLEYEIFDEGCCGMAGSFGFEEKHYEISQAVGQGLFKKLKDLTPDTLVLANGFSCQEQINQHSGRRVYHLAEILNWPEAKERPCKTKLSEKPSGPSAKVTSPRRAPVTAAK
jgi:Fe-S oxidoreductase